MLDRQSQGLLLLKLWTQAALRSTHCIFWGGLRLSKEMFAVVSLSLHEGCGVKIGGMHGEVGRDVG